MRMRRAGVGGMAVCLVLAGCGAPLTLERRYTGTLAGCPAALPSTLTRKLAAFAFAPGDGSLIIRGTLAPDGSFDASRNTQPPGKPPFLLRVQGTLDAAGADVTYTTPRCTATGHMTIIPVHLLP